MYAITGATGHTGRIITKSLLEAGKQVRIVSRDHDKAKDLVALGAELHIGSHADVELLKRVFNGVTAVYALIPASFQETDYRAFQLKHINALAEAMTFCKVPYVVSMSSQGAQHSSGTGIILGLHDMEETFNNIPGLNTLHLRPGYFMENSLAQAGVIKQAGVMGSPLRGDIEMYMIATQDIGNYAAKRLLELDFEGHNYQDLHGQRNITYDEIAKIYGQAIGMPNLAYVQFSYDDFKIAMMENWGATENSADMMNEFIMMINEGRADFPERTTESTTPTTIEEFAQTFKYVFENS
jgi:uncharacterized protein YbjT (DUF2867 family)